MSQIISARWWAGLTMAAAMLVLSTSTGRAADALRWKFNDGETLQYVLRAKDNTIVNLGGIEIEIPFERTIDMSWKVKSADKDGAELEVKIDRLQLEASMPFGGGLSFDSTSEKEPEGDIWRMFGPTIKAILSGGITAKVSSAGEVGDVTLSEELAGAFKALKDAEEAEAAERENQGEGEGQGQRRRGGGGGGPRGMMAMFMGGGGFGPDALKEMLEQTMVRLPADDAGDDWGYVKEEALGPIGTMSTSFGFKRGEAEADGTPINMKVELSFAPNEESEAPIELELTESDGEGVVLFDTAAGRTVKADIKVTMVMEGEMQGQEIYQERESTVTVRQGTSADLEEGDADDEDKSEADDDDDK